MSTKTNEHGADKRELRLVVLQRVCPPYRLPLFQALCANQNMYTTLLIGEDLPNSKVKNASNMPNINVRRLRTRFLNLGTRTLVQHVGLIAALRELSPDVILCEGESHFIGYLQAMLYRLFFNRRTALLHWCFITLPGQTNQGRRFRSAIKSLFRRFFDAFVVYSSYSKEHLLKLGVASERVFVATNVGDTVKYTKLSDSTRETRSEARAALKLPERFTVLYLGTLDSVKRPEVMLDLAKQCDADEYNFLLLGSGSMLDELRERALLEKLSNVFLPGRIVEELPLYWRASDVLLIPGRGGIVISEAMAFGLPTIVHEADGTEYDLVVDDKTGIHLKNGSLEDFHKAIEKLRCDPEKCTRMGKNARELVETRFTISNMVSQIEHAARFAKQLRSQRT